MLKPTTRHASILFSITSPTGFTAPSRLAPEQPPVRKKIGFSRSNVPKSLSNVFIHSNNLLIIQIKPESTGSLIPIYYVIIPSLRGRGRSRAVGGGGSSTIRGNRCFPWCWERVWQRNNGLLNPVRSDCASTMTASL